MRRRARLVALLGLGQRQALRESARQRDAGLRGAVRGPALPCRAAPLPVTRRMGRAAQSVLYGAGLGRAARCAAQSPACPTQAAAGSARPVRAVRDARIRQRGRARGGRRWHRAGAVGRQGAKPALSSAAAAWPCRRAQECLHLAAALAAAPPLGGGLLRAPCAAEGLAAGTPRRGAPHGCCDQHPRCHLRDRAEPLG